MYLLLLETSGNQNYIFSTNKLRENVGASELTYCVGTKWVLEIVSDLNQTPQLKEWKSSSELRERLTNSELNPPLELSSTVVEIIIATSGKALLITKNKETAQTIITKLTTKALRDAPGIDLCGVYVEFDWEEKNCQAEKSLVRAIKQVYKKFESVHAKKSSPQMRFLRLPVVDECSTSGFPASYVENRNNRKQNLSIVSQHKQKQTKQALKRISDILPNEDKKLRFARTIDQLLEQKYEDVDWLAVVHADGNGLGQIFLGFQKYLEDENNRREYVDKLRKFSLALDICTEEAFLAAIETFKTNKLPIVPIVLGGDDLTIICDGKYALEFTYKFLQAFEEETKKTEHQGGVIPAIAQKAFGVERLSACAGVAIIKPHFPFSVAYELAEDLIKQAKNIKKQILKSDSKPLPCSALDFHVLYDTSGVELQAIREKLTSDEGKTKLYLRPYVTTPLEDLNESTGQAWAKFHHWDRFKERVACLKTTKTNTSRDLADGEDKIANSQINNLYNALFKGIDFADGQYKLIKQRYSKLQTLEGTPNSLFAPEPSANEVMITSLLDALEAVDFLNITT